MNEREPWATDGEGRRWIDEYRVYVFAAAAVVLLIFIAAIWFAYDSGRDSARGDVPLVRASEEPYRHKPEEPGGMEVPDRDKLVYNRVSGSEEEGDDVQLRAGPELPIDKPEPEQPATPAPAPDTPAPQDTPAAAEKSPAPAAKPAPDAPKAAAASPSATPSITDGAWLIQLGAFGSADGADRAWRMLKDKYGTLLTTLKPDVDILERAGKDPLYRLRAGPFATRDAADKICARMKAEGQACFPVAR